MRVLTFLHSFEPGGVERVALRLVRSWREMGVDAPLLMGREDGALREEFAQKLAYGVPVQPRIGTASWETLWMILRLPGVIRRTRPDVLFVAGSTYTVVAVAIRLLLGRRCPPIVVKISNDVARRDLPAIARAGWRLWLLVQSRFARTWIIMDDAIAVDLPAAMAKRARVVHDPAIEMAQILSSSGGRSARARRFVAIGRLVAQKDYALMIRAFARAAQGDETLTIFGDGAERAALVALVDSLGLSHRIAFAGHVPDAASRLAQFDTLLLSSRYEGVPAVLVEALAAGLSVISTDSGAGVRSLLGGGRYGTIVPRNELALAAAIACPPADGCIDQDSLRAHLIRFTIERSALTYLVEFSRAAGVQVDESALKSSIEEFA